MSEDLTPDEARQEMAERHFMLSQAVIDRFEEMLDFLDEAETGLRGAGLASLADRAAEEADKTRQEIQEWRSFQREVEGFLQDDGP